MRKPLFLLVLCTSLAYAAEDPETLTARSQAKARKVIDSAVAAIGGRDALQGIETLKLQLQGRNMAALADAHAKRLRLNRVSFRRSSCSI